MSLVRADARHLPLADGSVQCVVTSPPYWGLRDYGTARWDGGDPECDHRQPGTRASGASTLRNDGRAHVGPYEGERTLTVGYPYRDVCGKCGALRVDRQIGLEQTPDAYVSELVAVFREVRRVLRDDGVLWLNLGSSYFGVNPGSGGKTSKQITKAGSFFDGGTRSIPSRRGQRAPACGSDGTALQDSTGADSAYFDLCDECLTGFLSHRDRIAGTDPQTGRCAPPPSPTSRDTWPTDCVAASPAASLPDVQASTTIESWRQHRGACSRCDARASVLSGVRSCAADARAFSRMTWGNYTGRLKQKDMVPVPWMVAMALQADGWYLRSDVIWAKPNPMPESVTDRPTKAHEYVFLLTKSERYAYDAKAISEPLASANAQRTTAHYDTAERYGVGNGGNSGLDGLAARMRTGEHVNRNARTVWTIATQPTSGFSRNVRQVRVSWDESDGDTTRITSPDCPVHGGRAVQAAKALCGGRGVGQSANTAHSDSHPAPTPLLDYVPTDQPHGVDSADETTDSSDRSHVPPATPRNTGSRRTARVPVTSPACTPSAQTTASTGDTSALRASSDSVGHMHASRSAADSVRDGQETSDAQTAARIAGSRTCSCDYYRIESEKIDHFATFPEALVERCVLAGSRLGDLVLDPFGGSGTTARVAISLGRRAVSTELNPQYLELARERTHVTRGLPLEVPA